MCKTKNILIEIIEGGEKKRTYVLRELPAQPGQSPLTLGVFESGEELASFLDGVKVE